MPVPLVYDNFGTLRNDLNKAKKYIGRMRNPTFKNWRNLFKRPAPPLEYRSTLPPLKVQPKRRKTDRWKA